MTRISVDILWIFPESCIESALQVCFWCWKCSGGPTFFFPKLPPKKGSAQVCCLEAAWVVLHLVHSRPWCILPYMVSYFLSCIYFLHITRLCFRGCSTERFLTFHSCRMKHICTFLQMQLLIHQHFINVSLSGGGKKRISSQSKFQYLSQNWSIFYGFLFICFHSSAKRRRYHITYSITKTVLSQGWIWIQTCYIIIPFIGTT